MLAPGVGDCIPAPRSFGLKPLTVGMEEPDPGAIGTSWGLWVGAVWPLPSLLFLPNRNDMIAPP